MKIRILLLTAALPWMMFTANAQTAREEILDDIHRSASNYYAYPEPTGKLTPAPKGYKPFYISHYGRHGSRWLIGEKKYSAPYRTLRQACDSGALTAYGKEIFGKVAAVYEAADKRDGELTPLGHRQHRGIAERMYRNFPEVFKGNTAVDAKSTVVIRCILSMTDETQRLAELNPRLRIATDASYHDMYYMNRSDRQLDSIRQAVKPVIDEFKKRHIHPQRLMDALFDDAGYVARNIDAPALYDQLFKIAANQQSLDMDFDFEGLFTPDECYDMWLNTNAEWYVACGFAPLTGGKMPLRERALLANIIDTADSCVMCRENNVTLRFGHESCLLPLACLMEIDDCGLREADLDRLAERWRNYRIYPMACNIQLVFYRKPSGKGDVLVKVLLNEREAHLPVSSDMWPYYKWDEVRDYYRRTLDSYRE